MKKSLPYLLGGLALVLLVVLMVSASTATTSSRKMDDRVTLRRTDKIPYGMRAAYDLLPALFPGATVHTDRQYPGSWDSINDNSNQAVFLVADYFEAGEEELDELTSFVKKGNHVFIIHRAASDAVKDFFGVSYNNDFVNYSLNEDGDSLKLKLEAPVYTENTTYSYPGRKYEGTFYRLDTARTSVLGRSDNGLPNFIQVNRGKGSFYLHTAPLAFSNYFILHKNNSAYFEQAISIIPKDVTTVVWNEFFLERPRNPEEEPNWLSALFSYPAFKWAFLLGAFTLALYVLLGMRRRQRLIPVYQKPKNDSMDFVKTLGRLYYDRKDHHNLASKMAAYFLEHVRSRYKIPTHTLDDAFIKAVHFKSGYPEAETRDIVTSIHTVHTNNFITETELAAFHKELEAFYQNT